MLIPFAEFGAVLVDEEAKVCEGGWFPAEGVVEGNVLGRGDEPFLDVVSSRTIGGWRRGLAYLATDNVCDLHQMIVYHVRKVIRRIPVRLHENEIFLLNLLLERAVGGVNEAGGTKLFRIQTHNMRLTRSSSLVRLLGRDGPAGA